MTINSALGKRKGASPRMMRWAYKAITIPRLTYGSIIWGGRKMGSKITKELRKLNRLACLGITAAFPNSPTSGLETICHLPPLTITIKQTGLTRYAKIKNTLRTTWDGITKGDKKPHRYIWNTILTKMSPPSRSDHDDINTNLHKQNYNINISPNHEEGEGWSFAHPLVREVLEKRARDGHRTPGPPYFRRDLPTPAGRGPYPRRRDGQSRS